MKNKKIYIWYALVVIIAFVLFAIFGLTDQLKGARDMRLGIDIRGGVEAIFVPIGTDKKPSAKELDEARMVMEERLDSKNILDREVTVDKKEGHIIIRFPWKSDEKTFNPEAAIAELGETAKLTFRDLRGTVVVDGKHVSTSSVIKNNQTGVYEVALTFDKVGATDFANATHDLTGQSMGIYMDETLISNPTVTEQINGGEAVINGMSNADEARALSDKINAGSLPFSLETTSYSTLSPTLGSMALTAMIVASLVAFFLVCIFMIFKYKLPGVISCLTLVFQMSLQLLALSLPQYTLTLPGIAGLILSLGMAVDANIITAERISEELQGESSIRQAVKNGYKNAFSSVLDGNITTAAVAAILMFFGSGTMLSFGYTLFTGVIINLLAGVWLSRAMLSSAICYTQCNVARFFWVKKERNVLLFSKMRKWILLFTALVLTSGAIISSINGIRLDTQFTGGVILKYTSPDPIVIDSLASDVEQELSRPTSAQIAKDPITKQEKLVLTLAGNKGISPKDQQKVLEIINKSSSSPYLLSESYAVEPYIGAKALKDSGSAILFSAIFIVLYIGIRFTSLSGLSAGITAILGLIHDIVLVFFVFGIFKIPLNDAFVAVTLTIIGYSINDTIVLYDRIRENIQNQKDKKDKNNKNETLTHLVDRSITETLGRSVSTAFTTVLCVFIIFIFAIFFNIESIKVFSLPLLIGLISGCYSSVCISGPLWATWKEYKNRRSSTCK